MIVNNKFSSVFQTYKIFDVSGLPQTSLKSFLTLDAPKGPCQYAASTEYNKTFYFIGLHDYPQIGDVIYEDDDLTLAINKCYKMANGETFLTDFNGIRVIINCE